MQIQVDITEHAYNNIMTLDSISLGRIPYKGIVMAAINAIKSGEIVNEERARKGHWIKYDKEYFTTERLKPVVHSIRECSECHTRIADFCGEMKYCPSCTAKMEGIMEE